MPEEPRACSFPSGVGSGCFHEGVEGVMAGEPHWPSRGQRQLFPLPLYACPPDKVGVSRVVRRRRERIRRLTEDLNDACEWA